jgi:hypothetical protein
MKIFVKTLKGTHFEIEVKPEDSVRFLLLRILSLLFFILSQNFSMIGIVIIVIVDCNY